MKGIAFLLLLGTFFSALKETHSAKIKGDWSNWTYIFNKIWLKGSGRLDNWLPDMTYNDVVKVRRPGPNAAVSRRYLKDMLTDLRNMQLYLYRELNSGDPNDVLNDNFTGEVKRRAAAVKIIGNQGDSKAGNSADKTKTGKGKDKNNNAKKVSKKSDPQVYEDAVLRMRNEHERLMGDVHYFLDRSYLSTEYIYGEVQRIKTTRILKDPLRKMVEYLSQPYMDELVKAVFQCFKDRRLIDGPKKDVWKNRVPNNWLINPLADPYIGDL